MIIQRDGKLYEVIEREISQSEEEYKLQAWKAAVENDARELQEYQAKIAEIDALKLDDTYKNKLKEQVTIYSPSGIKQQMIDEQEAIVNEIVSLKAINGDHV